MLNLITVEMVKTTAHYQPQIKQYCFKKRLYNKLRHKLTDNSQYIIKHFVEFFLSLKTNSVLLLVVWFFTNFRAGSVRKDTRNGAFSEFCLKKVF